MNTLFLRSGRGGIAALAIGSLVLAAGPSRAADAVPSPAPRATASLGAQARRGAQEPASIAAERGWLTLDPT